MILFYGEGRLGNQIFQYQALSQIAENGEAIYAVGLEDIQQVLELTGPRLVVLTTNRLLKRFVKYVLNPALLRPLARTLRLINYVFEGSDDVSAHCGASGVLFSRPGLVRRVTFVDGGYYQNASFWSAAFPAPLLRVKAQVRASASQYLKSVCTGQRRPSFVHVRRGDYQSFSTHGLSDLSLPPRFYDDAIRELEKRIGKTHLVFVTDDPAWVGENFRHVRNKSIASFNAAMDFSIMTECGSGILSNSTFSLAAAFMLNQPDTVIAPLYWFGFRIERWIPASIRVEHEKFVYIPVPAESTKP